MLYAWKFLYLLHVLFDIDIYMYLCKANFKHLIVSSLHWVTVLSTNRPPWMNANTSLNFAAYFASHYFNVLLKDLKFIVLKQIESVSISERLIFSIFQKQNFNNPWKKIGEAFRHIFLQHLSFWISFEIINFVCSLPVIKIRFENPIKELITGDTFILLPQISVSVCMAHRGIDHWW